MNVQEYQNFYDQIGMDIGWDFSSLQCVTEGVLWDFYKEVTARCRQSDILLDIGTGGAEKLLSIAHCASLLVGIDNSEGMMSTAAHNLSAKGFHNVRLHTMDSDQLQFPDGFFNIISCRQAPFSAQEVARVLTKDGVFLTQQVSELDKWNIIQAFGREQHDGSDRTTLLQKYTAELREAGFTNIQVSEYNATEYYQREEDLIFLLKHTPIIPQFGQEPADFEVLSQFIRENRTDKGIMTNSARFMVIAKK